jgi:hypothetical protein
MWRLFLSGLFCMPAVLLLAMPPAHVRDRKMTTSVAPIPRVIIVQASPITVSLPPSLFLAASAPIERDMREFVATDLATTPTAHEPAPTHRKLPARVVVHHDAGPILVAHSVPERPQESLWAIIGRWFAQHEAPKAWSPSPGGGAG